MANFDWPNDRPVFNSSVVAVNNSAWSIIVPWNPDRIHIMFFIASGVANTAPGDENGPAPSFLANSFAQPKNYFSWQSEGPVVRMFWWGFANVASANIGFTEVIVPGIADILARPSQQRPAVAQRRQNGQRNVIPADLRMAMSDLQSVLTRKIPYPPISPMA